MIDFSSKVITYFKADTTDIKAKMRDLSDEERKVQQEHLKSLESRNKTYDDWIGSLGKANQALELVGRAVGFAADSYSEYTRMLELRSAAGAASIEGLQRASLGLRTEQELLEFAAKAQNSTFKLSQEQMETAQKAMIALTRAGFDQEEVTNKVTDALVKANGGGLDDFGIKVKDASSDVERFNNLMAALADKASGVDQASMTSAEAMKASGVSMKESFDRIKQSIGELVASLAPLIQSVSAVVALGAKTLSWVVGVPGSVAGAFTTPNRSKLDTLRGPKNDQDLAEYYANLAANNQAFDRPEGVFTDQAFVDKFNAALERKRKGKVYSKSPFADPNYNPFAGNMPSFSYQDRDFWDAGTSEGKLDEATIYSSFDRMKKALKEAQDKQEKKGGGGGARRKDTSEADKLRKDAEKQVKSLLSFAQGIVDAKDVSVYNLEGWIAETTDTVKSGVEEMSRTLDPSQLGGFVDEQLAALDEYRKRNLEMQAAETMERRTGYLEQMFGPIEDFDAYTQGFATLGATFNVMSEAVGAGYEAIVKGQGGASAAIKRVFADGLMSIGKSSAIEALRETALGFGMLAIGNPKAGLHFQAAAMHAGVAVLAGAAARGMGAGGGPAPGGAGGAQSAGGSGTRESGGSGGGSSGGASKQQADRPITIIMGESFSEESPRMRSVRARDTVERAMRERDE